MKLIPHVINLSSPAQQWIARAPAYKRVDGSGTIVRKFWPDNEQNSRIASMAVNDTFNQIMALVGPQTKYVEVFNEVAQRQGQGLEKHADFLQAIAPMFHARGLKVVGFNFSVGNPGSAEYGEPDDFQYLFNRKFCGVDCIGYHGYWGNKGVTEPFALRYRVMARSVPSHPLFILTECGRDAVDGGQPGWKASGLSADNYVAELRAFAELINADPLVLYAAVFTAGPSSDWANFSTDELDLNKLLGETVPDYEPAKLQLEKQFGWSSDYAEHALAFYMAQSDVTTVDGFVGAYQQQSWRDALAGWNPKQEGVTVDTEKEINDLKAQIALFTRGLRNVTEGHYNGAGGSAAVVLALEGKNPPDAINPQPDYSPKA